VRSWGFSQLYQSGSSALEASWEARYTFWICMAPLRLGGLRGKQSTPSVWLGGTGLVSTIGEQQRRGAGATRSTGVIAASDKAMVCLSVCRVAWIKLMLRFKLNVKDMHSFTVISIFILVPQR
jgi:hypothetical protein